MSAPRRLASTPGAPNLISALPGNSVTLNWNPPAVNGGSPVSGYRIYRSTVSGAETFLVAVGAVSSYTDETTTYGTTYYYKLSAVNATGEGALSNELSATPIQTDGTAPSTPASVKALVVGTSQAALNWTASTDNVGVTAYRVYRDGALVGTTAGSALPRRRNGRGHDPLVPGARDRRSGQRVTRVEHAEREARLGVRNDRDAFRRRLQLRRQAPHERRRLLSARERHGQEREDEHVRHLEAVQPPPRPVHAHRRVERLCEPDVQHDRRERADAAGDHDAVLEPAETDHERDPGARLSPGSCPLASAR